MMHYSLDDRVMRPSGCCNDSSMPSCQSDFVADECVSFLQSFDLLSLFLMHGHVVLKLNSSILP
jgi:hypothetical protein